MTDASHPDGRAATASQEPSGTAGVPFMSAEEVRRRISPERARYLIEGVLEHGFEPGRDPARQFVDAGSGHLLLMPSVLENWVGVKVASVAPGNPGRGMPRIQALYMLMDAATLTPQLCLEGSVLTALRTPAMTAVACDRLAAEDAQNMIVFGSGPQAVEHVLALRAIRPLERITVVGRNAERSRLAVDVLAERGVDATVGTGEEVAEADVVVCTTSSAEPVLDASLVRDGACVAAIGSHEPDRRELPSELVERSFVVVEDRSTALREAGDVVLAVQDGALDPGDLHGVDALVAGSIVRRTDRPNIFKGTGMSWQDLAVVSGLMDEV
ncbi:ornithine cyclodeaminase family protein [Nesterenkonia halophila]